MPVVQNWLQGLGQCIGGSKVLAPWLMPRPPSRFLGGVSEPLFFRGQIEVPNSRMVPKTPYAGCARVKFDLLGHTDEVV